MCCGRIRRGDRQPLELAQQVGGLHRYTLGTSRQGRQEQSPPKRLTITSNVRALEATNEPSVKRDCHGRSRSVLNRALGTALTMTDAFTQENICKCGRPFVVSRSSSNVSRAPTGVAGAAAVAWGGAADGAASSSMASRSPAGAGAGAAAGCGCGAGLCLQQSAALSCTMCISLHDILRCSGCAHRQLATTLRRGFECHAQPARSARSSPAG